MKKPVRQSAIQYSGKGEDQNQEKRVLVGEPIDRASEHMGLGGIERRNSEVEDPLS